MSSQGYQRPFSPSFYQPPPTLSGYLSTRQSLTVEKQYAVIGIDFGTTFSGVSWTWSGNLSNTDQISSWKGSGRERDSDKVPSKIIYDSRGKVVGWGFACASEGTFQVQWFKLLLSDEAREKGGGKVAEAQAVLQRLKKEPVDVVADYLEQLWRHAVEQIELKLTRIAFDNMDLRIVLTVPANWDHKAQERTKKAAIKAGITARRSLGTPALKLVTEPEAAALSAWKEAGLKLRPDFQIGDCFTVCDAGGGTVDLISYKVLSLRPLRLEMCVVATGGLCGAIFLDQAFEAVIRTKVGRMEYDKLPGEAKKKAFDNDWEHGIKRAYNGSAQPWPVDIAGYKPKREGLFGKKPSSTIILEKGHVNGIFDPVCNKVVDLVRTQVLAIREETSTEAKAILLVGGFGDNDFLLHRLKQAFSGVPIQRPTNAWTAISRGAVAKGLSTAVEDEIVTNVIAKYSYGILYNTPFDPMQHLDQDYYLCPYEGIPKARNQVRWYLRRGQNVKKTDPVIYDWRKYISSMWDLASVDVRIYSSASEIPPTRMNNEISKVCSIKTDFFPEMFSELGEKTDVRGNRYRVLDYSLHMKVTAEDLEWLVYFEDQKKGHQQFSIDYE